MKDIKFTQVVHDIVSIFIPGTFILGTTIWFVVIYIPVDLVEKLNILKLYEYSTVLIIGVLLVLSYIFGTFVYYLSKPVKKVVSQHYKASLGKEDNKTIDEAINKKLVEKFDNEFKTTLDKNQNRLSYYGYAESYIIHNDKASHLQILLSKYRMAKNFTTIGLINFIYLSLYFAKEAEGFQLWAPLVVLSLGLILWGTLSFDWKNERKSLYVVGRYCSYAIPILVSIILLYGSELFLTNSLLFVTSLILIYFPYTQFLNLYKLCSKEISRIMYFEYYK